MDDLEGAESAYEAALSIYRDIKERLGEANTLRAIGQVFVKMEKPDQALSHLNDSITISKEIRDNVGLMASFGYFADTLMALKKPDEAVLALEESLNWGVKVQDKHGMALTLWRQAQALDGRGQHKAAFAALHRCLPLARKAGLPYEKPGQEAFERLHAKMDEMDFTRFMADLERDAESIRQQGIHSIQSSVSFRRRIDAYPEEVEAVQRTVETIITPDPSDGQIDDARKTIQNTISHKELGDIVPVFLHGAFVQLLRKKQTEKLLEWIERIDDWLPKEKRGFFEPFTVAARHISGKREDTRILDEQTPEVRSVVEWILSEAEKEEDH